MVHDTLLIYFSYKVVVYFNYLPDHCVWDKKRFFLFSFNFQSIFRSADNTGSDEENRKS